MGYTSYSCETRSLRASTLGYDTKSVSEIFTQQKARVIHESMEPSKVVVRECRDSSAHPNTVPIILAMDVTGSMGSIPHHLVKEGLPKLVSKLIQAGVPDLAILFLAVGDYVYDSHPLQVGQFESGDEELDMWLTRTYIEGGGGGNGNESYNLAWDFANRMVVTDAWEKRKEKGFIFTFGDEPVANNIPGSVIKSLYPNAQSSDTVENDKLLAEVREKWHVFHIHIKHNRYDTVQWARLLGQDLLVTPDYREIPDIVTNTVLQNVKIIPQVISESPLQPKDAGAPIVIEDIIS
jgi:hypothetical protein